MVPLVPPTTTTTTTTTIPSTTTTQPGATTTTTAADHDHDHRSRRRGDGHFTVKDNTGHGAGRRHRHGESPHAGTLLTAVTDIYGLASLDPRGGYELHRHRHDAVGPWPRQRRPSTRQPTTSIDLRLKPTRRARGTMTLTGGGTNTRAPVPRWRPVGGDAGQLSGEGLVRRLRRLVRGGQALPGQRLGRGGEGRRRCAPGRTARPRSRGTAHDAPPASPATPRRPRLQRHRVVGGDDPLGDGLRVSRGGVLLLQPELERCHRSGRRCRPTPGR